ncbi:MAG: PadR family transcriptional regulator [Nitrososphaerota archaeon]
MFPFRKWMRHTAIVPKGFLRHYVLELLNEKPMSGAEIMDEIDKRTNGCWRPSPGSVYPLLAWLQDNGYIKELPVEESGVKYYALTDKGKKLLEEQRKVKEKLREEAKFLGPPFLEPLLFKVPFEKIAGIQKSIRRLMIAFFDLGNNLEKKFSEEIIKEIQKIIDETSEKIEEINKKLKSEKNE